MRTDTIIDTNPGTLTKCPQIPPNTAGRPAYIRRGDFVQSRTCQGRVIGTTHNPDDGYTYFVVAAIALSGHVSERWVHPNDIIDTANGNPCDFASKAAWLYSDEFLVTPQEVARQASSLSTKQLLERSTNEIERPTQAGG